MLTTKRPSVPPLKANRKKIIETILFLIEEAARRGTYVTTYDIVKTIFVADVSHLNSYGRPITFDNYYAMKDGPVPSDVYSMLTNDPAKNGDHEREGLPLWNRELSPEDGNGVYRFVRPKRSANLRALSETDIAALKSALSLIKAQSFSATRDMTHEHPAYIEAWDARGDKSSCLMRYDMLLDCPDSEVISDLTHASHYS